MKTSLNFGRLWLGLAAITLWQRHVLYQATPSLGMKNNRINR